MTDRGNTSDRAPDRVRQQVLDYLLGTLDDSEMEAVRARLESDSAYRHAMRKACSAMVRLQCLGPDVSTPPQLAGRTCEFLFDSARRVRAAARERAPRRSMTPVSPTMHSRCRLNRTDVGLAALIFLVAGLLTLPAVNGSRFQYRVTACKDNLMQVGQSLNQYSRRNHDLFPVVPAKGNMAAAGIYAPILAGDGFWKSRSGFSALIHCRPSRRASACPRSMNCVLPWGRGFPRSSRRWAAATATLSAISITASTSRRGT